ncbi:GNAT family N-acetyltransferase [Calidifontibacter terrae]
MTDDLRTLHGRDELLATTDNDPYIRWECSADLLEVAWQFGDAVGFRRRSPFRRMTQLNLVGPGADIAALVDALLANGWPEVSGVSVDQEHLSLMEDRLPLGQGGDWDWMWTTTAPALPAGIEVVELNDTSDAPELLRLNEIGNPTAESEPGKGVTERWLGVRTAGRILAAGALHRTGAGAPHLTGIVTHPRARGQGLGAAVTAALTAAAIASDGVCTLGMYSGNDVARRLYHRLGYRTAHAWASRPLRP